EAAVLRDRLHALSKVLQQQTMELSAEDTDIVAVVLGGSRACVVLAMVRGGRHLGDKAFFPSHVDGDEPAEVLEAFVSQHYLDHRVPPVIVLSHPLPPESEVADL